MCQVKWRSHPSVESLDRLVAELNSADAEHPAVSVADETGWALSAFRDGRVFWENVEADDEPMLLEDMSRGDLLDMFRLLAAGDLDALRRLPWRPRA
jgi:hypothetical protein